VNRKTIAADYPNFNWQGFAYQAECAAHDRVEQGNVPDGEEWALVAFIVYELLAAHERKIGAESALSGIGFELSAMNLRLWMISRLGAAPGNSVRDPAIVIRWFLENTGMTLEEARRSAADLRALPMERWPEQMPLVRSLRAIKNRLSVVRQLKQSHSPEIERWLELSELLP
jgi:hypothetical protein